MVVLNIYSQNIKIKYKSKLLSQATFFVFIFNSICVIFPFIIAHKTGGFWQKRDIFHEQPNVKFKGEYAFFGTTSNISRPILCGSVPYYQDNFEFLDHCHSIKVRETDYNFDTKLDELNIVLEIYLKDDISLTSISLILPIEYNLHTVCPLKMESAVVLQQFVPNFISKFSILSDLKTFQSQPLSCSTKKLFQQYNVPILSNINNFVALENIIEDYLQRNISTHLTNVYTNFKTTKTDIFTIELRIRISEHTILYKPRFWQIVKWAWMQYFAIYIIIASILKYVKRYIFNNKLVLFYEQNPLKKNK